MIETKGIEEFLISKNVKPTAVRILVLKFFAEKTSATSLKELENHYDFSEMTTLYRTLKTFVEHKILHTIDDGTGKLKYAKCVEGCVCKPQDLHYHFHCLKCKETICLIEEQIPYVNLPDNYSVLEANMVVKGLCSKCNQ